MKASKNLHIWFLRRLNAQISMSVTISDLPLTKEILRIIMQMDDLVVTRAQTQYDLKRISGARGLCLDVWARDSRGHIYNLEIQRDDSGRNSGDYEIKWSDTEMKITYDSFCRTDRIRTVTIPLI